MIIADSNVVGLSSEDIYVWLNLVLNLSGHVCMVTNGTVSTEINGISVEVVVGHDRLLVNLRSEEKWLAFDGWSLDGKVREILVTASSNDDAVWFRVILKLAL